MLLQMLMATDLRRTDSMVCPQTFQFDQNFEFEELIGKSTMSEVRVYINCCICHRACVHLIPDV